MPPGPVGVTSKLSVPGGDTAETVHTELSGGWVTLTEAARTGPRPAVVTPQRFVPLMVTVVPPPAGPKVGEIGE